MNIRERFYDKVNFNGPVYKKDLGPCYEWTGALDKNSYGRFDAREIGLSQSYPTQKMAWVFDNGPIPEGYTPDHLCTNQSCVRISHLELVTHAENNARAHRKLTKEQVGEIRERLKNRTYGLKARLAREYGVSFMTITFIERNKTWKEEV